jgi:hypothetical protein
MQNEKKQAPQPLPLSDGLGQGEESDYVNSDRYIPMTAGDPDKVDAYMRKLVREAHAREKEMMKKAIIMRDCYNDYISVLIKEDRTAEMSTKQREALSKALEPFNQTLVQPAPSPQTAEGDAVNPFEEIGMEELWKEFAQPVENNLDPRTRCIYKYNFSLAMQKALTAGNEQCRQLNAALSRIAELEEKLRQAPAEIKKTHE